MNKLGFYLEKTNDIPGLVEAIREVKPPALLTHVNDRGILQNIRRELSPETFVIGRLHLETRVQDAWLAGDEAKASRSEWLEGDAAKENGRAFARQILAHDHGMAKERFPNEPGGRLLIDAWMSLNECLPGPASKDWQKGSPEDRQKLRAKATAFDWFQAGFRECLREEGLEAVAFNFGAGNFRTAQQYLDWFPETLQSYIYLGFHEYGWPTLYPVEGTKTSATLFAGIMSGIRQDYDQQHKAIISEAGLTRMYKYETCPEHYQGKCDLGWLYPDEPLSQDDYWRSLAWYNDELCKYDCVLGACLFSVGPGGDWQTFRHLGTDNEGRPLQIMSRIKALASTRPSQKPEPIPQPQPQPIPSPSGGEIGNLKIDDANIQRLLGKKLIGFQTGGAVYKLDEVVWLDPSQSAGLHHIFLDVVDRENRRMASEQVRVSWPGGETLVPIEEKPGEMWGGNFAMFATLGSYTVEVLGPSGTSDVVTGLGLGTPDEPHIKHHTSFGLRFKKL
jgi:hypothetical protein